MDKLDFSKPEELQTRDGRSVRIYATDGFGLYCVHGAIKNEGGWVQERWDVEGMCYSVVRPGDLIRKPYRMTGWVNVYEGVFGSTIFATKEAAKIVAGERALGQIYIDAEVQS